MKTEDEYAKEIFNLELTREKRIQAAFHLEKAKKEESLRALGKALMSDPSPIVRHEFAFSLGETGRPDVVAEYLMTAVKKAPNFFVRHEAILALATLGKKEFVPFVKKFIDDKEPPEMLESAEIALERLEMTGN